MIVLDIISFILKFAITALAYGNVIIQPSPFVVVTEGSDVTFNCTYQHSENEQFILSVYKGDLETDNRYVQYAFNCMSFDPDEQVSNVSCSDDGNTMTITILLTDENYVHDQIWFCRGSYLVEFAKTTIHVKGKLEFFAINYFNNIHRFRGWADQTAQIPTNESKFSE